MDTGMDAIGQAMTDAMAGVLRAEKARRHLTLDQLAARSGIARRTVARLLKGETVVDMMSLAQMAAALETTPHRLMTEAVSQPEFIATFSAVSGTDTREIQIDEQD